MTQGFLGVWEGVVGGFPVLRLLRGGKCRGLWASRLGGGGCLREEQEDQASVAGWGREVY